MLTPLSWTSMSRSHLLRVLHVVRTIALVAPKRVAASVRTIVHVWVAHRLIVLTSCFLLKDSLLGGNFVLIIVEELATEEEAELNVVALLILGHLLEFGSVAGNKLSQFVDDVPQLLI